VPQVLSEALGTSGLVAVRFPARSAEGREAGDVLVVLGGRLVHELAGRPGRRLAQTPADRGDSARHSRAGNAKDLIARVRSLKVRASADVGGKTMTLGELSTLAPGSVIDLGKKVTEPLELRVGCRMGPGGWGGHLVAHGDAVTLPRGFGFRVRYLGVK
jgi:flagellar motor switch/type III secretory pathway protein FliN